MGATEFLVDGVRLGPDIFYHSTWPDPPGPPGDLVGRIAFDRLDIDTTNQIFLDDLQVLPQSGTDVGLSDVGMYTTIFGRVTKKVTESNPWDGYFYVNDGSNFNDGTVGGLPLTGNVGIRCRPCSADGWETAMPELWDYALVTGTMGVTNVAGNNVRFFYTWFYAAY